MNKIFLGHTDLDLSPLGYSQAEKTAEYISENFKPDIIYSSDLLRAYNTALAVSKKTGASVTKAPELREIYAGDWEGKSFFELSIEFQKDYGVWLSDIGNAKCTNGESVSELQKRVISYIESIAEKNSGKTVVVSTHATVIRTLECIWKNVGLDQMRDIPWVSNASISVVNYHDGKWETEKTGYDSFMGEFASKLPKNV